MQTRCPRLCPVSIPLRIVCDCRVVAVTASDAFDGTGKVGTERPSSLCAIIAFQPSLSRSGQPPGQASPTARSVRIPTASGQMLHPELGRPRVIYPKLLIGSLMSPTVGRPGYRGARTAVASPAKGDNIIPGESAACEKIGGSLRIGYGAAPTSLHPAIRLLRALPGPLSPDRVAGLRSLLPARWAGPLAAEDVRSVPPPW